jgi:hypothetical protein
VDAREAVHVISAYRSPHTNAMLRRRSRGVAQYSQHTVGHAMDFFIPGVPLAEIRAAGLRLQRGGVGFYPTSGSPFVHLDTGGIRHWPRMTRDQLVRVFPDGKTVHIPSDGRPLSGYALALSDVERRGAKPSAVSLAAARSAGAISDDGSEQTSAKQRNGNLFARLFGFQTEDEDEPESVAAASRSTSRPAIATRQEIVAVPLPPMRPPVPGEFRLASAQPAASEVISSRGHWRGDGGLPAPQPEWQKLKPAIVEPESSQPPRLAHDKGPRLVWAAGPQGQPIVPDAPMPRPRRPAASPELTASVGPWQAERERNDRVPTDLVLAYAADPGNEPAPAAAVAPMGSRLDAAAAKKRMAAPLPAPKKGQRADDPWLRALVIAPNAYRSLSVAALGVPDYRQLRSLMHKPRLALAMVFSRDPHLGMNATRFSGEAVAFLPTVTFIRTASLF